MAFNNLDITPINTIQPTVKPIYPPTYRPNYIQPTVKPVIKDPIIGVWRFYFSSVTRPDLDGFLDIYRFNADGTYVESGYNPQYKSNYEFTSTWSSNGDNSYACKVNLPATGGGTVGLPFTIIYDPSQNVIYDTSHPTLLFTPYFSLT